MSDERRRLERLAGGVPDHLTRLEERQDKLEELVGDQISSLTAIVRELVDARVAKNEDRNTLLQLVVLALVLAVLMIAVQFALAVWWGVFPRGILEAPPYHSTQEIKER